MIYKHELFSLKCDKKYKIKSKIGKLLVLKKFNEKHQITEDFIKEFNDYFKKYKFFFKSLIGYKEWTIISRFHEELHSGYPVKLTYCGRIYKFEHVISSLINFIDIHNTIQNSSFSFTYDKITFDNLKVYIIALSYKNTTLNFTFNFYLNLFRQYIEKKELFFTKKDYKLLIYYITEFQKNKTLHIKKKLTSY